MYLFKDTGCKAQNFQARLRHLTSNGFWADRPAHLYCAQRSNRTVTFLWTKLDFAWPISIPWPISRVRREMQRTRALRHAAVNGAKRAVTELSHYPRAGEKLHGFTLLRSKHVPELELTALHLQHDKTGAEHLHIARDDSNNVFSIGFKTNPPDDTGVPHILEHTTLCGSEK
jgi:hypothetical protein